MGELGEPGLGIGDLTLYTFSMENWSRPRSEVAALMRLLDQTLREQVDEMDRDVDMQTLARRRWEERARSLGLLAPEDAAPERSHDEH